MPVYFYWRFQLSSPCYHPNRFDLPFDTEISQSIFNYVDVGDVQKPSDPIVRDWMGGDLTYKGHQGTDYKMKIGTKILAAAPGTIIGAEDDWEKNPDLSTIGNRVVIDHGNNFHTAYNHLSRIAVKYKKFDYPYDPTQSLEKVNRGDIIAYSGYTGTGRGPRPHLHFEAWPPDYRYYGLGRGKVIDAYRDLYYGKHGRALLSDRISLWTKDNDPQYTVT